MIGTTKEPWSVDIKPGYPAVIYATNSKELICEVDGATKRELAVLVSASVLLIAAKGALAALSQPKTHDADIAAAKKWLADAVADAEKIRP